MLLSYLTSHGCSSEQADQLSEPYYSQVEKRVSEVMGSKSENLSVEDDVLTWTVTDGYNVLYVVFVL
jgi:hypothetical protein